MEETYHVITRSKPKRHRFPVEIMSYVVWSYHRFNDSYRTDKLKSYNKPIKYMCKGTDHRQHKGLNNRVENAHQPNRRKEKCLIKFKSPSSIQKTLSLMGKTRNIFAVAVGYKNTAQEQRTKFREAKEIWNFSASQAICA